MAWRHIMFAVDPARRVRPPTVRKLSHLARMLDAEIELFQCVFEWTAPRTGGVGSVLSDQEMRAMLERRHRELDGIAQSLREAGTRARVTVSWDHPAYEGIVRQVLKSKPDLLVVQSARHTRLARLVMTYTDYKLIETCPCPLLLLKNERAYMDASVLAAVDPMHANDKPAALDETIVEAAREIAKALGAELHVCHAFAPWTRVLDHSAAAGDISEPVYAEICDAHRKKCESRVKDLAHLVKVRDDRVHLAWGHASELLPKFARSMRAGIVVMGAVSRSGLQRAFIGHTAERVLDALDADILVVKPPDFQTPVVAHINGEDAVLRAEGASAHA